MSRSWREWGAERKLRSITKEHENWKREALEELGMAEKNEPKSVYVIINEWTDISNDTSSEIVGGKWFSTEDDAWDALNLVAEALSVELPEDETSIQLEDHTPGLQSEEYRIEELIHA